MTAHLLRNLLWLILVLLFKHSKAFLLLWDYSHQTYYIMQREVLDVLESGYLFQYGSESNLAFKATAPRCSCQTERPL